VNIFAVDKQALEEAQRIVESYALVPEVGQIYEGIVDGVVEFGAFVEIAPGVSGLVHVSEISDEFVKDVNKFVKVGDKVKVKLLEIDSRNGKMKLTMKNV
jgi:polyribonucleotide nucleotidyltransferase